VSVKTDETTMKNSPKSGTGDRPVIDKVADTLALGDADAKQLLDEAPRPHGPRSDGRAGDLKGTPSATASCAPTWPVVYAKAPVQSPHP